VLLLVLLLLLLLLLSHHYCAHARLYCAVSSLNIYTLAE
jgi:hypothetical protein